MTALKWLAGGAGRRVGILMALVPMVLLTGVAYYFRRSRNVPVVAVVVHCIDIRYSLQRKLRERLPIGYHWSWPGSAKEFVEDPMQREVFLRQFVRLRHEMKAEKLIWVDHCDCKGYGSDDSREKHCTCLREARRLIGEDARVADLPVELYLHDLETNTLEPIESS